MPCCPRITQEAVSFQMIKRKETGSIISSAQHLRSSNEDGRYCLLTNSPTCLRAHLGLEVRANCPFQGLPVLWLCPCLNFKTHSFQANPFCPRVVLDTRMPELYR